jgi:Spy/CpxP family protein refolding chaperone
MTNEQLQDLLPPPETNWSRRLIIGGVAAVVVIGAGVAAFASGEGPGHWRGKLMRGFMEYRIEQALTDAGASADQKEKIKALFTTTMKEVRPDHDERKQMHDEVMKLLESPTIDRTAIESLRVKHVAEMEAKSKVVAKAIGDAAEILTPEQRRKLVEEWGDMGPGSDMDHD